jgi:hypothetical protein
MSFASQGYAIVSYGVLPKWRNGYNRLDRRQLKGIRRQADSEAISTSDRFTPSQHFYAGFVAYVLERIQITGWQVNYQSLAAERKI